MRKLTLLVITCSLAFASLASAQPQSDKSATRNAIYKLQSPDPGEVLESIRVLAASRSKDAVDPLTDLLRKGPRNDITNAAIEALGSIGAAQSLEVIIEYLGHRRPDARITALYALQSYNGRQVIAAIENALRDSDRGVRNSAALALGNRGATKSVPILFLAFDRGVEDASIAIGQIGSPKDAKRLSDYLGRADITLLLSGFFEFLGRSDIPEDAKIEILNKLITIAGPEVRLFYVAYKNSFREGTEEHTNKLYRTVSRLLRKLPENQ